MESRDISDRNFDGGFNTLICQEDSKGEEHRPNQDSQGVFMSSMIPSKHCRLVAVSLVLLAAFLLVVDISLGVHYNNLIDTHLTLDDAERINSELIKLGATYKTAIETTKGAGKQLDSEMSQQKQTKWESEHQTRRSKDYEAQIDQMKKDISEMRSHLPMISDGCKRCPLGWILMNSVCYYFSSSSDHPKSWQNAREYCQLHGGDLAVIDSKDKQIAILNRLRNDGNAFLIGLRNQRKVGLWQWPDGTVLVEGYWKDGEPNNIGVEECVAVYSNENFFKSWHNDRCQALNKWICEKAPTQ